MTEHFLCDVCGNEHAGVPTDRAYKLPDVVWAIPEPERSALAKFTLDLCQLGERYFIRGVLQMPFVAEDGYFGWGVWIEVEWRVFELYLKLDHEDASAEPPHAGNLANALSPYESSLGAHVLLQFGNQKQRPLVQLAPDDGSRLAIEQRNGIDNARYHEILTAISVRH